MISKKKEYKDPPRFPRVQTKGYEKEYKEEYLNMIKTTVVEVENSIISILKNHKI